MPAASALKILLVEDQASMRGLIRYTFQQINVRDITEAKNGIEALEALKIKKFDLVVSDWNMEGMDGLTLLKMLRRNPVTKTTAFIMATGQADRAKVKEAVDAGVNNYIVKPFNAATLKSKIEAVLGKLT
ncbi:MAG: response regulator [Rhodospirillales bacterium]|nr:response regulator [Rhodospirillales bacterium]